MELTAVNNPQVKAAAELKLKKHRQARGLFLAEGLRTVEEAVAYKQVESIFYTAIEDDRTRAVLEAAAEHNDESAVEAVAEVVPTYHPWKDKKETGEKKAAV